MCLYVGAQSFWLKAIREILVFLVSVTSFLVSIRSPPIIQIMQRKETWILYGVEQDKRSRLGIKSPSRFSTLDHIRQLLNEQWDGRSVLCVETHRCVKVIAVVLVWVGVCIYGGFSLQDRPAFDSLSFLYVLSSGDGCQVRMPEVEWLKQQEWPFRKLNGVLSSK